jgi:Ribbon-helix-helix protein, copG family
MMQMAIRIPAEDALELDAEAAEKRTTRSELVRLAVAEHIARRRHASDPWAALVLDGSVIPATRELDLSTPLPVMAGRSLSDALEDDRSEQRF